MSPYNGNCIEGQYFRGGHHTEVGHIGEDVQPNHQRQRDPNGPW